MFFFRFIVIYYPLRRSEICTPRRAKIVVISLAIFAMIAYTFALWTSGKSFHDFNFLPFFVVVTTTKI